MESSFVPPPAGLSVTFWGAAQSVTGSMHLVQAAGRKILLDCGIARGHHHAVPHPVPARVHFPFAPAELDAVVLSHAHIDHCGNLPNLVRHGFAGPIYCTPATADVTALMLHNSARIHEEEEFVRQVLAGSEAPEAPAGRSHVAQVVRQCIPVPYEQPQTLAPDLELRLNNAGHILGSAIVVLTAATAGRTTRLVFTGDLGRRGAPLLADALPVPAADLVLSESTYGGRVLEPVTDAVGKLEEIVRRTVTRGGKVLVPAFSLGRTQVLVHVLQESMTAGRIPEVPVFVDSPLAADIADAYRRHPDSLDEATARRARERDDFLAGKMVRYIRATEESKELTTRSEPCVIVAPGGMCEGGRVLQHLKYIVDDPRCSVVLVSYQAPNTPGRRLLERGPTVRFHGRKWNKWADVIYLAGFSGHADHNDLLAYLGPLAGGPTKLCLVHGEPEQAASLRRDLRARGVTDVTIPNRGETVRV
jgi:metallo-beta-lactamase family protein